MADDLPSEEEKEEDEEREESEEKEEKRKPEKAGGKKKKGKGDGEEKAKETIKYGFQSRILSGKSLKKLFCPQKVVFYYSVTLNRDSYTQNLNYIFWEKQKQTWCIHHLQRARIFDSLT